MWRNLKLGSKYYGPYLITVRIGVMAYRLALPPKSRVHPMFHVSLLKKKLGDRVVVLSSLPSSGSDGQFLVQPVTILRRKMVKNNVVDVQCWCNGLTFPLKMLLGKTISFYVLSFLILMLILEGKDPLKQQGLL